MAKKTPAIKFDKPLKLAGSQPDSMKPTIDYGNGITLTTKAHADLLQHCKDRLTWGATHRDRLFSRYCAIDRELAGYIKLEDEDAKRKKDTETGHGPKPYPIFLQLTKTQLDEAMTYLLSVFFPEEGPYAATAPVENQDTAKSFTALMNRHSAMFNHLGNFGKFAFDGLRYNIGLASVEWKEQHGTAVANDTDRLAPKLLDNQKLYDGNAITYLDPYNTLYDPSVSPLELATEGEFFAEVEVKSAFSLRRRLQKKKLFNVDKAYLSGKTNPSVTYYKTKPIIIAMTPGLQDGIETNWVLTLSAGVKSGSQETIGSFETVKLRILLDATQFGIGKTEDYTIWEVELVNNERIVNLKQLTNAHGLLPIFAVRPWDDNFGEQTSSFAEMLLPYQRFSSFQLNVHQLAARKALYGMTFYNSRIFGDLKDRAMDGGLIPTKSTAEVDNMNNHIKQVFDVPDTQNTLRDIEVMDTLMQKILPTDILKQVTDLERATEYQSAATVQGANRRNLKIAQTIDAQAFDKIRQVQMYNILEKQEQMKFLDSKTGNMVEVNPADYREAKIEFMLGTGLRGLDKLMIMGLVKDITAMLVQNAEAAAKFDVGQIINYLTTLAGDSTNFAQFMYKNEFDKLTPQQKEMAFQLLQQAMQAQAQQTAQKQAGVV